jgi:uncharacterized protein YukE
MDNNAKKVGMSASTLNTRIMTLAYQMAEMGRLQEREANARFLQDYDGAALYAKNAEMYRNAINTLKEEIQYQVELIHAKAANAA